MFTGVLFDNRLDGRDIAAGIIYLAVQGFLSIKKTEKKVIFFYETNDYEITLLQPTEPHETKFQTELISILGLTGENTVVSLSDIRKDSRKMTKNAAVVQGLKNAVQEDLLSLAFVQKRKWVASVAVVSFVISWILIMFQPSWLDSSAVFLIAFFLIIQALLLSLLGYQRRTTLGYEALNYLKGFKEFLSVTEKERYKFFNAPTLSPTQFMEYLPYAIAFGVETKWAELFKDLSVTNPNWYSSTDGMAFNAIVFTNDMSSFSSSLATNGVSGGGAGGGGFSGGGGGGGGSW
jgi:uncharacterized membrane protein